jgi:hypothetical protein
MVDVCGFVSNEVADMSTWFCLLLLRYLAYKRVGSTSVCLQVCACSDFRSALLEGVSAVGGRGAVVPASLLQLQAIRC